MKFVEPIRDKKKIQIIKEILKATSLRDHLFFTLGINSGIRISDLLALSIEDVLDEHGKVKDRMPIREKKSNKAKVFPINDVSKIAIFEYLQSRDYETEDEPLFISKKKNKGKTPLLRQQAYKIIHDAAREAGIMDQIGTHTLRKTFGYHAYKSGVDIETIQKLFNHASSGITLQYIGITQDDLEDVYLNLNL